MSDINDEVECGVIKALEDEIYKTMVAASCYTEIRPGAFEVYVNNEYWHKLETYLSRQAYWHSGTFIDGSIDHMKIMGHPVYRVVNDHPAYRIVNNIISKHMLTTR